MIGAPAKQPGLSRPGGNPRQFLEGAHLLGIADPR
jgi:hypothetical protein